MQDLSHDRSSGGIATHESSLQDPNPPASLQPRGGVTFVGEARVMGPTWAHAPILGGVFFGTQVIWSTEMAYASSYLHSLGLSKAAASMVLLAGPLSGLVVQPLAGAFADRTRSRYGRRRPFMLVGSLICAISMLVLSWAQELSTIFSGGERGTIIIATISFYCIDFTINAVMAADRALGVDILPSHMQETVNLWVGRAVALGGFVGFLVGRINLPDTPIFNCLGNTQLQILSAIVSLVLITVHSGVSLCITEKVLESRTPDEPRSFNLEWRAIYGEVSRYVRAIPKSVKQICWILFCTWVGFFPFMFWGSFWIAGLYKKERVAQSTSATEPFVSGLDEEATRAASSALAWHAGIALAFAIGLPFAISNQEHRASWSIGYRINLVTAWGLGQLVFSLCMFSTWFIHSYRLATIMFGLLGFPSAMLHWAPYALLGEEIAKKSRVPSLGGPTFEAESSPLLPPSVIDISTDVPREESTQVEHKAGELLGITNVFVVLPQFLMIGLSSLIFAILEPDRTVVPQEHEREKGPRSIEIVFSIGGLSALVGLFLTTRLRRARSPTSP